MSEPVKANAIAVELAECIGRYMSETIYRRRLSPAAADFVAGRGVKLIPPQLHRGTDPTWPGPWSGNSQPEEESNLKEARALAKDNLS